MLYQRYKALLPTLIMIAGCLNILLEALSTTTAPDGAVSRFVPVAVHYGAGVATAATLASFFLLRPYYRYFFGTTFLLALLGIIDFSTTQTRIGLGFGSLKLSISPFILLVGAVTYFLVHRQVNKALFALIKPSEQKIQQNHKAEIVEFKNRFARKSTEELLQIVAAKKLVPAAVSAAGQLLQERQTMN
jgi:hypothetical protein